MDWFSDPERYGEEIANGWKAWQLAEVANAARIQFESAEAMWQAHPHYKPVPKWS